MKVVGSLLEKLRLIFKSKLTYVLPITQVIFLVAYMHFSNSREVSYLDVLRIDIYMWVVFFPCIMVQNRVAVFTTFYSTISRAFSKKQLMMSDFFAMAISTLGTSIIVTLGPLSYLIFIKGERICEEEIAIILFLIVRYLLIGLLIQLITYGVIHFYSFLQKKTGVLCLFPLLLFFVLTFPMEYLETRDAYSPLLDFSAGRKYAFYADGVYLLGGVFFYNVHLIGYIVALLWTMMEYLSARWEYIENEGENTR